MPSKCDASPQLLDRDRGFFCPGSKMHNNDIMANALGWLSILHLACPVVCLACLFFHKYPFSNVSELTPAAFSSRCLSHDIILFTMETKVAGLCWVKLVLRGFCFLFSLFLIFGCDSQTCFCNYQSVVKYISVLDRQNISEPEDLFLINLHRKLSSSLKGHGELLVVVVVVLGTGSHTEDMLHGPLQTVSQPSRGLPAQLVWTCNPSRCKTEKELRRPLKCVIICLKACVAFATEIVITKKVDVVSWTHK